MKSQSLPIRLIVIAGLGILAMVVGAAMFVIGMRGASQQTRLINATQAECQGVCASLSVSASNYYVCDLLKASPSGIDYSTNCADYGPCIVLLGTEIECSVP